MTRPMTVTEKILARAAGRDEVAPGDLIMADVDLAMGNDVTAPVAIARFKELGIDNVWDPSKVALVPSHFVPAKDIASAKLGMTMREFARQQGIEHYFELGRGGIEHILLPEQALALPGQVIIGADSHSCTYGALGAFSTGVGSTDLAAVLATGRIWLRVPESVRFVYEGVPGPWVVGKDLILSVIALVGDDGCSYQAMEHTGPALQHLSMDSRFTLSNMAIEAGAKSGIVAADEVTLEYVRERQRVTGRVHGFDVFASDDDAVYGATHTVDVGALEPQVSLPSLPSKAEPVSAAERVVVDQVFIGSCTNAKLEDLRMAAHILRDRRADPRVRLMVIPATQEIWMQANREGLLDVFAAAGATVSTPTCGACLGGHMGVLGPGEVCVSTSNRNYVGRMGHKDAKVYLTNPAVAAATAVTGRLTHPDELGVEPPEQAYLTGVGASYGAPAPEEVAS
ncbi:MAG TPA: 3-isopropylmalate dehydratase large subunit [Actinomycetota bacterium]|nr:3-isopropylmalate dehydratase large subunit [Actinomycetota bacterium]